jgi:uncharacterized protein YcbK (DUF882 family)
MTMTRKTMMHGSVRRAARREFLRQAAGFGVGLLAGIPLRGLAAAGSPQDRTLTLHHTFNGESLEVAYRSPAGYDPSALAAISHLMRDRITGEVKFVDPRLLDYLYAVQLRLASSKPFYVNSGYRSPQTNARLRRSGRGAALNSYHVKGKAVDVWVPGVDITVLQRIAREIRAGGVGYYPDRHFVHLDVGPVRYWTNKEAT